MGRGGQGGSMMPESQSLPHENASILDNQKGPTYSPRNYIQHPIKNHTGKEHIHIKLNHFDVYQKLTQHC